MKKPNVTLADAIQTIEIALDYYHSMDLDYAVDENGHRWWQCSWETAYDLLERIQGLPEHSLYNAHIESCESCQERGLGKAHSIDLDTNFFPKL